MFFLKIAILTFFSLTAFADIGPLRDLTKSEVEFQQLKERLELFGLVDREGKRRAHPRRRNRQTDFDFNKFIAKLQKGIRQDLNDYYLPEVVKDLGTCSRGECLTRSRGYVTYQGKDKSICYPDPECGFYSCMEKKYGCEEFDINYFTGLAKPTCQAYVANSREGRFSQFGMDWIFEVMVCLQKGLVDHCERGDCKKETKKKTCEEIVEFTLKFHPGCYYDSGIGVCNLSLADQINIWRTVGPFLTAREWQEAIKVVASCLFGRS